MLLICCELSAVGAYHCTMVLLPVRDSVTHSVSQSVVQSVTICFYFISSVTSWCGYNHQATKIFSPLELASLPPVKHQQLKLKCHQNSAVYSVVIIVISITNVSQWVLTKSQNWHKQTHKQTDSQTESRQGQRRVVYTVQRMRDTAMIKD